MKNMIQKTILTFVITASLLSCLAMTAFASTPTPYWSHWTMIAGDIEIESDNYARITVLADCSPRDADNVKVTCELQQYTSSWKTIKTWTESEKDSTSFLMQKYYAIAKKYSYRLKVTAKAYKGTTLKETVTSYFDYGYYQ